MQAEVHAAGLRLAEQADQVGERAAEPAHGPRRHDVELPPGAPAQQGVEGNRGLAWIELERPVRSAPVSEDQLAFAATVRRDDARAGVVAGWAQSLEQCLALLAEAGAPLRCRTPWPGGVGLDTPAKP